jgi:uncharacterized RDD family membrane protein YckC
MMYGTAMLQDDLLTQGVLLRRVCAFLLDGLILSVTLAVLWCVLMLFGLLTLGLGFPLLGLLPVVPFCYHLLFLASPMSATPGQAALGLIVRRNDDLGRPTFAQALVSVVGFYITIAFGVIWLAVALLTVRRRTFHDMVSCLVVVRARALQPATGYWSMPDGY